jgi:hypothetical protein
MDESLIAACSSGETPWTDGAGSDVRVGTNSVCLGRDWSAVCDPSERLLHWAWSSAGSKPGLHSYEVCEACELDELGNYSIRSPNSTYKNQIPTEKVDEE